MPIPPSAPYDTLATVTQLTRTVLGDYIAGIQPNVSGVVNTNGLAVLWVSGNQFSYVLNGATIVINGIPYQVALVTSSTTLNLVASAGVQNGVGYSAVLPTGDIFADSQAYVVPTVNLGWRKLQGKLADKGHPRLEAEADILALPVVSNLDPICQQSISWNQFFDGTNFLTPNTNPAGPVLPQDFISPLRLWERMNGPSPNLNTLLPMHPVPNALRARVKGSRNRYWDWRGDAIYFPGSILPMDLRVRYAAYLADIVVAPGGFGSTPIPIMRCADALAFYTAAAFVMPRGGEALAPGYMSQGDEEVDQITNSFAKLQQRASYSRRSWGARGRRRAIR